MKKTKENNGFLFNLLLITIFFNIWFPKAGIKLLGIPLTVGNVFMAITFILWLFVKIKNGKIKICKTHTFIVIGMLYYLIKYVVMGNIIANVGYIIPLIVYPLIFFIVTDMVDTEEKMNKVLKIVCYGYFFICIYSLLQYVFGITAIQIPGLTVNFSDYQRYGNSWYLQKNNNNNGVGTKIFSTYQNGNLFAINVLIIYPIVYFGYKNKNQIKRMITSLILFILCVFLSLSRSCWLGIVLFIIFGIILSKDREKKSFILKFALIFLCIIMLAVSFKYFPSIVTRFSNTDSSAWLSMSGRAEGLKTVFKTVNDSGSIVAWFIGPAGVIKYEGLAYEMTPLAIFAQVGIIGLLCFYGSITSVLLKININNAIENGVMLSIIIWIIVGCIEGAMWLPPTALNIYLVLGLGLSNKIIRRKDKNEIGSNNIRISTNTCD